MIVYKILLVLVTLFASLMAFGFIPFLVLMFANPAFGLFAFVIACIALYAFFANKFFRSTLIRQQPFSKKQSDMLNVNAIVVFIFSVLSLQGGIAQLLNPSAMPEMPTEMQSSMPSVETIRAIIIVSICFSVILLIHVIWTFLLHRKYKKEHTTE